MVMVFWPVKKTKDIHHHSTFQTSMIVDFSKWFDVTVFNNTMEKKRVVKKRTTFLLQMKSKQEKSGFLNIKKLKKRLLQRAFSFPPFPSFKGSPWSFTIWKECMKCHPFHYLPSTASNTFPCLFSYSQTILKKKKKNGKEKRTSDFMTRYIHKIPFWLIWLLCSSVWWFSFKRH